MHIVGEKAVVSKHIRDDLFEVIRRNVKDGDTFSHYFDPEICPEIMIAFHTYHNDIRTSDTYTFNKDAASVIVEALSAYINYEED